MRNNGTEQFKNSLPSSIAVNEDDISLRTIITKEPNLTILWFGEKPFHFLVPQS